MTAEFDTGQRFGAYLLGKLLGRGGMGVVYQAQHVHLGRTVALKLLAPELSENEDFRARFLRESRLAAALDHPGIVTVYDAGDVNGVLYLAMRFVRGTDLAALLVQRGPLDPTESLAILEQVAAALDAAHAAGLVHRDVKPANVMIEGQRCYLTDFGLTKRASSDSAQLTAAGQFLGTVDYISPEQIEGREVDGRADGYALGCVLFECLTGSRPYPRDSQIAVIYAQLREPPPRACELRPDLPPAIDAVIDVAMAKAPEARYESCGAMVVAARAALAAPAAPTVPVEADLPPAAPPPTPPQLPTAPLPPSLVTAPLPAGPVEPPATREPRRRSPLPFVAATLALVAIAVAAVVLLGGGDDKTAATSSAPGPPETPSKAPATDGPRVVGDPITVGGTPEGIVVRDDALWVANQDKDTVTRVASDGRLTAIPVGDGPFDVAGNDSSVWVANKLDGTVSRIALDTGRAGPAYPVGTDPYYLTAQNDFVYVSNGGDNSVTVLDATTGKRAIPDDIPVGNDPRGITTMDGAAWVTNSGDGTIQRIAGGAAEEPIETGAGASNIAAGNGALWVSNTDAGTVSRVVPSGSGYDVTSTNVGIEPLGIAFGDGSVWVAVSGADSLVRLDPETGKPRGGAVPLPGHPAGIAQPGGSIWVTLPDSGTVVEIDPQS